MSRNHVKKLYLSKLNYFQRQPLAISFQSWLSDKKCGRHQSIYQGQQQSTHP